MFTLGYPFRPWPDSRSIVGGAEILRYVRETAAAYGVDRQISYHSRVVRADWSSQDARWTVTVEDTGSAVRTRRSCSFLYLCSGYYRYDQGYTPDWPGQEDFAGPVVHPQHWPEDLDVTGQRVVVIGSGATAVTLIPEMAKRAAHVTMLQRSPSYVFNLPTLDAMAATLRRWLPARVSYPLLRTKNVLISMAIFQFARRWPALAKQRLIRMVRERLPANFDIDRHFTPRYNVWDQRVCVVTDGDLFKAIGSGAVTVVTDEIDAFTGDGILLKSGAHLAADVVVVATGLKLNLLGDIEFTVNGARVEVSRAMAYKGAMLSGVPNMAYAFGYTNASWTLKADLTANYVCRLLRHMDSHGYAIAIPRPDPALGEQPFLAFTSGYVVRALKILPKQGSQRPWKVYQNYFLDALTLRWARIDDGVLDFERARARRAA